jgi:hypothetical protein
VVRVNVWNMYVTWEVGTWEAMGTFQHIMSLIAKLMFNVAVYYLCRESNI